MLAAIAMTLAASVPQPGVPTQIADAVQMVHHKHPTTCWTFEWQNPGPSTIHCNDGSHNPGRGGRLDVIMFPEADAVVRPRCDNRGGWLMNMKVKGKRYKVCVDVDF